MVKELDTPTEDNVVDDSEEVIPFKYSIASYGADYPVDGLVKRIGNGSIYIPSFQRGYVWTPKKASRFVESLLLGLPVPGIFLSKEETQKLLVIDGQQRLRTLQYFYDGIFEPTKKEFALKDVQPRFNGATYKSLLDEDRRRLDDSILHATIVRQDEPSDDDSSVYHIFERLNTGGTLLKPQQIRASIYHGDFNDLLNKLNNNRSWRSVYGKIDETDKDMRDQELILRFFALYFNSDDYKKPMKEFLNSYMGKNRKLQLQSENELSQVFIHTIGVVESCLGSKAFKPKAQINAAVFDAVMVGIARRLEKGNIESCEELRQQYQSLLSKTSFKAASESATTDEENINKRITLATNAFANAK